MVDDDRRDTRVMTTFDPKTHHKVWNSPGDVLSFVITFASRERLKGALFPTLSREIHLTPLSYSIVTLRYMVIGPLASQHVCVSSEDTGGERDIFSGTNVSCQ